MERTFLTSAVAAAVLALLALPALTRPGRRIWLVVLAAIGFLDSFATALPAFDHQYEFIKSGWNWSGKLLDLALLVVVAFLLVASRSFSARDLGLALKQAPDMSHVLLLAVLPFLAIVGWMTWQMSAHGPMPDNDTILFQLTMPSLTEEIAYRGIILALFDRMFAGRLRVLGANVGYGVVASAIAFGVGHGIAVGRDLSIQTYIMPMIFTGAIGLFLAWLRERTQSLVLPMAVHSAVNLINIFMPAFR